MAVVMEGPLSKWTNVVKGWQYRWFVLDDNTGLLSYYTSKEKMMRGARRGCLRLKGANLGIDDEDDSTFTISCDQKTFHFQARDSEERELWIRSLEDTIKRHSQVRKRPPMGMDFEHFDPTRESLDLRLAEAEAYYKILSGQIKMLTKQMNADFDAQSSQRYAYLKESSENMLASVGQCLRLMYRIKKECEKSVTKETDLEGSPKSMVSDHYETPSTQDTPSSNSNKVESEKPTMRSSKSDSSLSIPEKQSPMSSSKENIMDRVLSKSNFELSSPTSEPSVPFTFDSKGTATTSMVSETFPVMASSSQVTTSSSLVTTSSSQVTPSSSQVTYAIASPGPAPVPYASYSSSDEEEAEFFDATTDIEHTATHKKTNSDPHNTSQEERKESSTPQQVPGLVDEATGNPGSLLVSIYERIVWDPMNSVYFKEYDQDDRDVYGKEIGSDAIKQHGSVITHLLSQVRLGMDLTKVVLPTFILETRSLLEMYADFFSHPDLFVEIVDKKTPEERIIQVLKWFLSAMSAGRKGSVAKKPYNPILGETFRCFWILPECASNRDPTPTTDGPVPWASKNDVTFLAEQVSHHPPISALYAENRSKQISFGAHIWTKSKFLGLSIGVENVGQGCVSVLPYDEEYIVTFPNGYARSILTVPWIEIGGKCGITCAKTGYSASVQFHCVPFYGGKKHKISCEVMAPNDKKPVLTINGEWNGIMYAKYADRETEDVFIDAANFPTHRKYVKRIDKQDEFESKRLWKDVTINLKKNDVDKATEAKHKLEERQRAEARERKELGTKWETKLFHEVGGHWLYDKSLQKN